VECRVLSVEWKREECGVRSSYLPSPISYELELVVADGV
jgi:hypothetical protein